MDFRGFLSSKEKKEFFRLLSEQWGCVPDVLQKNEIFHSKNKFFLTNRCVELLSSNLRINNLGLYFAELKNGDFRLSIEGSQIVGPCASKNIFQIDSLQLKKWFSGEGVVCDLLFSGFVILKYKDDFVGSGKFKEGRIINFVPKVRRVVLE